MQRTTRPVAYPSVRPPKHWWPWCAAAAILTVVSAQRSAAQIGGFSGGFLAAPGVIALNDATPTASFTLNNGTDKAREVWLGPSCEASLDSAEHGDPIADAWHNQSPCAVPWLSGYPRHVVLAAHEERKFSMQVFPSPTLPDGHYTARLIWAISLAQVSEKGDTTGRGVMHEELAITYDKGPQSPRRSRTRWQTTVPAKHPVTMVGHTPAVLVLDDSTPTATFTLINPGATPTEVWLAVDCPWFRVNYTNYPTSHQYESAWHGRMPSAAFWLSGYPQHLVLAPHEQRTISIQAFRNVIAGRQPPGSYYARVVYMQSPVLAVTASGDTTYSTPQGTINVVYHKRKAAPSLAVSQLQRTAQPDGTSQACLTVEQPGLGAVVVLHAEVDDAHGHPVRALASAGSAKGGHPRAWGVDTTVAVLNVVHHNPISTETDGMKKTPDPVCFALPSFAPGHYQLAVSAFALEDTAKHQPAQATLPLEIP